METSLLKFYCEKVSTNDLLKFCNHANFKKEEIDIIGAELNKRFPTQEELEVACERVLGGN